MVIWSNFSFLHKSLLITFPTQLCLILYSFCTNLLHSLVSLLSPCNVHFLFCCTLSLYFFQVFLTSVELIVFHWTLSDIKSPQVSRTLLSILANINNAVIWMVLILPPILSTLPFVFSILLSLLLLLLLLFSFQFYFQFLTKSFTRSSLKTFGDKSFCLDVFYAVFLLPLLGDIFPITLVVLS